MGNNKKIKSEVNSCWYNRLQGALFLLAFLTYGIGDTLTSIWMIEQRGIMSEGNAILQYIFINYGTSEFINIKLCVTISILLIPFLILNATVYWMINGYLFSFIVAGTLGIILNIQTAMNEVLIFSPQQVIVIFMSSVLILTTIGEEIDKYTHPQIKPYFKCILNDILIILLNIINIFKKKT